MTYEAFIELIKAQAVRQLGFDYEEMELFREGYTSDDLAVKDWIRDANLRYTGQEGDALCLDILAMKMPHGEVTDIHRVATKRLYEDYKTNGFSAAFARIRKLKENIDASEVDYGKLARRGEAS